MRAAAIVVGGIVAVFPFAAGLGVMLHPLRRRSSGSGSPDAETADFVRICTLDMLPADGAPLEFPVATDSSDAWTKLRQQRVGSVFVSRDGSGGTVRAFTSTCPHLGCAVEFDPSDQRFECPCHESGFAKDGSKLFGPSLRGLDPLEVKLIANGDEQEVWVRYERFKTGLAEREPVA